MFKKWIKIDIFPLGFYFIIGDREKANTFINMKCCSQLEYIQPFIKGCTIEVNRENGRFFSLWLEKPCIITLVHEINHLVLQMLEYIGIKHTWETTETYAYITEYIFKKITYLFHEEFQSSTKTKNKKSKQKDSSKKTRHNS